IRDFHVTGVQTCALPISGYADDTRAARHARASPRRRLTNGAGSVEATGIMLTFPFRRLRLAALVVVAAAAAGLTWPLHATQPQKIGRASCRERGDAAVAV